MIIGLYDCEIDFIDEFKIINPAEPKVRVIYE